MTFKPGDRVRAKNSDIACAGCSEKKLCGFHMDCGAEVAGEYSIWVSMRTPAGECRVYRDEIFLVSPQTSPQFKEYVPRGEKMAGIIKDLSTEWGCYREELGHAVGSENLTCDDFITMEDINNEFDRLTKGANMKRVWEIIVINKDDEKVLLREIVIDGDEKSACSKVSISFADKLKDILFNNLYYIAREIGQYEVKQ